MTSTTKQASGSFRSFLRRLLPVSAALALTLTFGTADAWAKANASSPSEQTPPAESVQTTRQQIEAELPLALSVPLTDEMVEYAQREAKAQGLDNFHGGDVVVITSTGIVLLLLIILIIVLI